MTKKHFEAFADQFSADVKAAEAEWQRTNDGDAFNRRINQIRYAATTFAILASRMNGKFDQSRFMEACGL